MPLEINEHVAKLTDYIPFEGTSGSQIYEYTAQDDNALNVATVALTHVENALDQQDLRLIVLTGDAGHGKTHLSAQTMALAGLSRREVNEKLRVEEVCSGLIPVTKLPNGKDLFIIKDLSEISPESLGCMRLKLALQSPDRLTLVCANEGRLRAICAPDQDLKPILDALKHGVATGIVSPTPELEVINLNFQSVAAKNSPILSAVIDSWHREDSPWAPCNDCDAKGSCPILANRTRLADGLAPDGPGPFGEALLTLFRTAEAAGAVVTIRQLLILLAYATTGGLDCEAVHAKNLGTDGSDRPWQTDLEFTNLIFGERMTTTQAESVPSLRYLRALDPGYSRHRMVDEALDPIEAADLLSFPEPEDPSQVAAPQTGAQAKKHGERARTIKRSLRRADYFQALKSDLPPIKRLGLRYVDEFRQICDEGSRHPDHDQLVRSLVLGLEAIQGIRRESLGHELLIADAAFPTDSKATVIQGTIPSQSLKLLNQREHWDCVATSSSMRTPEVVDWCDRRVYLRVNGSSPDNEPLTIPLGLNIYEFLRRAADGLPVGDFFASDIRTISFLLGALGRNLYKREEYLEVAADGQRRKVALNSSGLIESW
ncbi:MAG: hypothetical protein WCJ63_04810 [Actinomycetes bacterium]